MNRHRLRKLLVESRLRGIAHPVHAGAVAAELALVRLADAFRRPRAVSDLTAMIKTFERPRLVRRLVNSLRRLYPEMPIIVADDSREPIRLPGVETVSLPFDSGVSAGRQAALERVRTRYLWNLDDDFVVFGGTNVSLVMSGLERYPEIDLVGGWLIDLPHLRRRSAHPSGIYSTSVPPKLSPGTAFGADPVFEVRDKVSNFFVARTAKVREVGYTAELKRLDHADFFTRARGRIVSTHCDGFFALHAQTPFDRNYQRFRESDDDYAELAMRYRRG